VGAETNSPLPAQRQVQGGARKAISYQSKSDFLSITSPTDEDKAPRSYFINGWNDYFYDTLDAGSFNAYMAGNYPRASLKENIVKKVSDTILFGEKQNTAADYFMDMLEGTGGNDADRAEPGCHSGGLRPGRGGGSNFAFVDGSARYLKYGESTWPVNLWAISDADREYYHFQKP
jgi:prepilin-type processing-associated H-X9-DG protein